MNAREPRRIRGLHRELAASGMAKLADALHATTRRIERDDKHGDQAAWRRVIDDLPAIDASSCDFTAPAVRIGEANDCNDERRARLRWLLLRLKPWRKGPFDVFGVRIDSEWRADWKWARLAGAIDLRGCRVLDVGCGNGYYLWRMLGGGAKLALGIDPGRLFVTQFEALKRYCPDAPAFALPLTDEQFPVCSDGGASDGVVDNDSGGFDTVFSMGVLYHRRDPRAHLRRLLAFARPGGEVVVESLVSDGGADDVLVPAGRYAKMRNVHAEFGDAFCRIRLVTCANIH